MAHRDNDVDSIEEMELDELEIEDVSKPESSLQSQPPTPPNKRPTPPPPPFTGRGQATAELELNDAFEIDDTVDELEPLDSATTSRPSLTIPPPPPTPQERPPKPSPSILLPKTPVPVLKIDQNLKHATPNTLSQVPPPVEPASDVVVKESRAPETQGHHPPTTPTDEIQEIVIPSLFLSTDIPPPMTEQIAEEIDNTRISDAQLEDARELERICQSRLRRSEIPKRAAHFHFELAHLYEFILRDLVAAARHYNEAAQKAPEHLPSIQGARRTHIQLGRFREALRWLEKELSETKRPEKKAALYYLQATILEDEMQQSDAAIKAFRQATQLSPTHLAAWKARERLEITTGREKPLLETYTGLANAVQDAETRAEYLFRKARRLDAKLDKNASKEERELTLNTFIEAWQHSPKRPGLSGPILRHCETLGRWRQWVEFARAEMSVAPEERHLSMARHIANILARKLGEPRQALALLEEQNPDDQVSLAQMIELADASGESQIANNARNRLFHTSIDDESKIELALQLAKSSTESDERWKWFSAAWHLDPLSPQTRLDMREAADAHIEWEQYVHTLERANTTTSDIEIKELLLREIADVHEFALNDPAGRNDALIAFHEHAPKSMETYARLRSHYLRESAHAPLALLLDERKQRAGVEEKIEVTHELATLLEFSLGDANAALEHYNDLASQDIQTNISLLGWARNAERSANTASFLQATLKRIAATNNRNEQVRLRGMAAFSLLGLQAKEDAINEFTRLINDPENGTYYRNALLRTLTWNHDWREFHRVASEARKTDASKNLLRWLAHITAHYLERPDEAIELYRILASRNDDIGNKALVDLLSARGQWSELAQELEKAAPKMPTPVRATSSYGTAAYLHEERLQAPEKALRAFRMALNIDRNDFASLRGQCRILYSNGAWNQLVESLSTEFRSGEANAQVEKFVIVSDRLANWKLAEDCLKSQTILDLQRTYLQEELLVRSGNASKVGQVLESQAMLISDQTIRGYWLMEAARTSNRPEQHTSIWRALHTHEAVFERAAYSTTLAEESRIEAFDAMAQHTEIPRERAEYLLRAGTLLEDRDQNEAYERYKASLQEDSARITTIRAFGRVSMGLRKPEDIRRAANLELEVTQDNERAVRLLRQAAREWMKAGAAESARDDLITALDIDPDHASIPSELVHVRGPSQDVFEALKRAATRAQADRAAEIYVLVAELYRTSDDLKNAAETTGRALAIRPNSESALFLRASLLEQLQQWPEAIDALERLVSIRGNDVDLHFRIAKIAQDHLRDHSRCQRSMVHVLAERPEDPDVLHRYAAVLFELQSYDDARSYADRLLRAKRHSDDEMAALEIRAKSFEKSKMLREAANDWKKHIEISGTRSRALEEHSRFVVKEHARWEEQLDALSIFIQRHQQNGGRFARELIRFATIQRHRLGDIDGAIETLRKGTLSGESAFEIAIELAEVLAEVQRYPQAIHVLRDHIREHETDVELWRRLSVYWDKANDKDEVQAMCAPIVMLEKATANEKHLVTQRRTLSLHPPHEDIDQLLLKMRVRNSNASGLRDLLGQLDPFLSKIFPLSSKALGISRKTKVGQQDSAFRFVTQLKEIFPQLDFDIHVVDQELSDVAIAKHSIAIPEWLLQAPRSELSFLLSRAALALHRETPWVHQLQALELRLVVDAACRIINPAHRSESDDAIVDATSEKLQRAISFMKRKQVEQAITNYLTSPVDVVEWWYANRTLHSRVGLLLSDDIISSCTALRRSGDPARDYATNDLLRVWASDIARHYRNSIRRGEVISVE